MERDEQNAAAARGEPTVLTVDLQTAPWQGVPVVLARPAMPRCMRGPVPGGNWPVVGRTDTLAVASAVCGFTAIVPVVSQVMGLALGIASLMRIRRARRYGSPLRGRGWALAGIFSSGFVLLSWIAIFAVMSAVSNSLTHTAHVLGSLPSVGG